MHNWLMSHQNGVTMANLKQACEELQIDQETFEAAMTEKFTLEGIAADTGAAAGLGIRSVPMVIVNGKQVPRWKLEHENLLGAIIYEAASGR